MQDNRDPYEALAEQYLLSEGLTLIDRNYGCRAGEIDLIMREHDVVVFVEVRFRKTAAFGSGLESVGRQKQLKLIKTANYYLLKHKHTNNISYRFDIVSMSKGNGNQAITYHWVKNAIEQHY
jgi:putative endonuclease